jgi:DNA-binding NarL/FixJ family response regulator
MRPACRHGHPYPQHLAHDNRGWAFCRACARTANRAHYTRNQPAVAAARRAAARRAAAVDPMAVERAISGDPPKRLTPVERAEIVAVLTRRGLSVQQIAERARCTGRTVTRIRARSASTAT